MNSMRNRSQLTARVLRSGEQFQSIASEWKDLFSRCSHANPFQHPEWLLGWIEAFTPRDLFGIELRKSDRLVGFAPLLIYRRDGERVLAFAGGGVSDYLGSLAENAMDGPVIEAMLDSIGTIPGWTVLDLTDLHKNSPLLRSDRLSSYTREHDVCFVLPLPESPEQLVESLSRRQWANLRNARSRTRREGRPTIEQATRDTVPEFLDELFRLHAMRWNELGQEGVLNEPRLQNFHRGVAAPLCAAGLLRLSRFRLNDRTIAVVHSFFHLQTVFCYLQGFDPEFSHLSPGTQLMFSVIEDAVKLGMQRFDFLRGEEAYKLNWSPCGETSYRVELHRSQLAAERFDHAA
jgi:CelD/BcsL family acetyltransferase involved in cellulose biosynthesis